VNTTYPSPGPIERSPGVPEGDGDSRVEDQHDEQGRQVEEAEVDEVEGFRVVLLPVRDADDFGGGAAVVQGHRDGGAPEEARGAVQGTHDPHHTDHHLEKMQSRLTITIV